MTFGFIGFLLGVLFGLWRARKAGGNGFDQAQYALVVGMIFGVIGVVLAIVLVRSA